MADTVIVDAVRTPVGKKRGALGGIHPVDLSAHVLRALLARTGLDPGVVGHVLSGCVDQIGVQSTNNARSALLATGMPEACRV